MLFDFNSIRCSYTIIFICESQLKVTIPKYKLETLSAWHSSVYDFISPNISMDMLHMVSLHGNKDPRVGINWGVDRGVPMSHVDYKKW